MGDPDSTSNYEPAFAIYDPNGNAVTSGEEPATDESVTRTFVVPSTGGGTYTAVVENEDASSTGAYVLSVTGATAAQAPVVASNPQSQSVQAGATATFHRYRDRLPHANDPVANQHRRRSDILEHHR